MIWPFTSAREAAAYQRGIDDAANHVAVYAAQQFAESRSAPAVDTWLAARADAAAFLADDIRGIAR